MALSVPSLRGLVSHGMPYLALIAPVRDLFELSVAAVVRQWIRCAACTAAHAVGACESVSVMTILYGYVALVATFCGAWYADNVLVSFSITL